MHFYSWKYLLINDFIGRRRQIEDKSSPWRQYPTETMMTQGSSGCIWYSQIFADALEYAQNELYLPFVFLNFSKLLNASYRKIITFISERIQCI